MSMPLPQVSGDMSHWGSYSQLYCTFFQNMLINTVICPISLEDSKEQVWYIAPWPSNNDNFCATRCSLFLNKVDLNWTDVGLWCWAWMHAPVQWSLLSILQTLTPARRKVETRSWACICSLSIYSGNSGLELVHRGNTFIPSLRGEP